MNTPTDTDAREQLRVMIAAVNRLLTAIELDYRTGRIWKTALTLRAADDVNHLVAFFASIDTAAPTATIPTSPAATA